MNKHHYSIIGTPSQVAMVNCKGNLSKAKRLFYATTFSNGAPALEVTTAYSKREAEELKHQQEVNLAYVSGRLGHWITPSFIVK